MARGKSTKKKGKDMKTIFVTIIVVLVLAFVLFMQYQSPVVEDGEGLAQMPPLGENGGDGGNGQWDGGESDILTPEERKLFELINNYRENKKRNALTLDVNLVISAKFHNNFMASKGPTVNVSSDDLFHNGERGSPSRSVWEVVSAGGPKAEDILQTWKNSGSHDKILLKKKLEIIGVAITGSYSTAQLDTIIS